LNQETGFDIIWDENQVFEISRKQIHEILNIGMNLRQTQLQGLSNKSGKEIIDEWIKNNC
jgi:hypothetical protein